MVNCRSMGPVLVSRSCGAEKARAGDQARLSVMSVISAGTPRRMGGPQ